MCKALSNNAAALSGGTCVLCETSKGSSAHRRSHKPVDAVDILACPFYKLFPEVPEVLVLQRLTLMSYHVEEGAERLKRKF